MRAVNHYSPFDGSEMVFTAPIEIEDKYFDELSRICRAVRNIGYKRTRGFGAVRCELLRSGQSSVSTISGKITDDEATYELRYSVRNESALMLPGSNSSETDDYISGTSIMGFFANQYLKNHSDDSDFEEMFLRHGVISRICISPRQREQPRSPRLPLLLRIKLSQLNMGLFMRIFLQSAKITSGY